MTQNNNQEQLIKLLQDSQRNSRNQNIISACAIILAAIPTFILLWKSFERKKLNPKVRKSRIDTTIAKLQLDRKQIDREAAYENERLKLETGLDSENSLPEKENKLDIFSNLKNQGENLAKDKFNQVSKVAGEKINEVVKLVKPKKEE
jgi:hypothetical protein